MNRFAVLAILMLVAPFYEFVSKRYLYEAGKHTMKNFID